MPTPQLSSTHIKAEAQRLGFFACGIAPALPISPERAQRRQQWLDNGCHAQMSYLERNEDKRRDPRLLVPGVRSIVSVALNYYTSSPQHIPIARYARGLDYHDLVKNKLQQLLHQLTLLLPHDALLGSRAFVDTAPIDERYWAWRAGLGWIGKNTQLIIPGAGSYFFLGELFLTLPTDHYDSPTPSRCGNCTRCLQACPTQALSPQYGLDARRCLSYLTIEYRGETLPYDTGKKMGDTFYGCDRCADCCPWNRRPKPTLETALQPSSALLHMTPTDWQNLTLSQYQTLFKGSAVKRAKYAGLIRNIKAISSLTTETAAASDAASASDMAVANAVDDAASAANAASAVDTAADTATTNAVDVAEDTAAAMPKE